jgi:hypothetical protein
MQYSVVSQYMSIWCILVSIIVCVYTCYLPLRGRHDDSLLVGGHPAMVGVVQPLPAQPPIGVYRCV